MNKYSMDDCVNGPFVFRVNDNGGGPHLLVQVCTERGWREYTGDNNNAFKDRWNLWWKSGGFPTSHYKRSSICRKDNLVRHLKCMRQIYGSIYDISPPGYNLPSEYTKLAADCSRFEKDDMIWICKPVGQSQGRGIFLFRKLSDLTYDSAAVVQKYIEKPLLIGGYKFDLRLYVCVPSYRPLTIYLYKEGIARFATEKFTLDNIDDPFRHLTNFALNKLGPGYSKKKERIGAGSKWSFRQLRRYMDQSGFNDWFLWQRIASLINLTILSQISGIPKSSNCFEFFGFDVLVDANLKPWLLEVNVSPALGNNCEVDIEVKKPLLHDLFDLLGLPVCNTGLSLFKIWSASSPVVDNCVDDYCTSKYYQSRSSKRHNKVGQDAVTFVNVYNLCSRSYTKFDTLCIEKNIRKGFKGNNKHDQSSGGLIWDNGRDWNNPKTKEGGWIRIYPFIEQKTIENIEIEYRWNSDEPKAIEKEIKNSVLDIQKFIKAAKDIYQKFGKDGDEKCNELFTKELELNTEIWLPEK
ncbi:hypothetical protein HCN44_005054 [Aphidius gifuensis]|uniref:Tubulin polyglutamylase TTLL2 n=1 Tax=Aphidius gifuensis TaxID=684658 RepID=A0A834XV99_APHGI|nr:hypothetical protein HCN44_005054 [Aphidius gifuensis]